MNTSLTVADCRRTFGSLFSTDEFIPYLNQACDQLIHSGRWIGSLVYVGFDSSSGFITLPYEYSSVLGINIDRWVPPVFSQFHRYIESGPGKIDETKPCPGFVMDMGDGYATLIDPPTAGSTLRIVLDNAADVGKTIRFYGISNGQPIFDVNGLGMNITPGGITTNETTVFDTVTGIEMPLDATGAPTFVFPWTLYSVDPDGNATQLSRYYPPDIRPSYHRYQTGTTTKAIQCLCQRRFIPVYKETDWVFPGSLRAIKAAMQAVQCEDANNYQQAAPLWALAYDTLNKIAHNTRGAARPDVNFMPLGVRDSFPTLN